MYIEQTIAAISEADPPRFISYAMSKYCRLLTSEKDAVDVEIEEYSPFN